MARVFDESFKKMAIELSYLKRSVAEATKELDLDPSRLSKWRQDPRFNGGTVLSLNTKLSQRNKRSGH